MSDSDYKPTTPLWMKVVIILVSIPALIIPFSLNAMPDDTTSRYLLWLYPAYVILSAVCAWLAYPQRKELAWIILVLMILSHFAVCLL